MKEPIDPEVVTEGPGESGSTVKARRELIGILMIGGYLPRAITQELFDRGFLPAHDVCDHDAEACFETGYNLVKKDMQRMREDVTRQVGEHVEWARLVLIERGNRLFRDSMRVFDDKKQHPMFRASALRTAMDAAKLVARASGVETEKAAELAPPAKRDKPFLLIRASNEEDDQGEDAADEEGSDSEEEPES